MRNPKRQRHSEAQQERQRHPLVPRTNREHLIRNRPRDSEGIKLLDVLPRPNIRALDRSENRSLVLHNRNHHDPVEQRSDNAAQALHKEGAAWRQMRVLREFEVFGEQLSLLEGVVGVAGEVEVREWAAGEEVAS